MTLHKNERYMIETSILYTKSLLKVIDISSINW